MAALGKRAQRAKLHWGNRKANKGVRGGIGKRTKHVKGPKRGSA